VIKRKEISYIYHIAAHITHALISISCLFDELLDIVHSWISRDSIWSDY